MKDNTGGMSPGYSTRFLDINGSNPFYLGNISGNSISIPNHTHSVSGNTSTAATNSGGSTISGNETRPKNTNFYVYIRIN